MLPGIRPVYLSSRTPETVTTCARPPCSITVWKTEARRASAFAWRSL